MNEAETRAELINLQLEADGWNRRCECQKAETGDQFQSVPYQSIFANSFVFANIRN